MARLNGWQRLWVVAAMLYGVFVLGLVATNWPTYSSISSQKRCSDMWLNLENNGRVEDGLSRLTKAECEKERAEARSAAGIAASRMKSVIAGMVLWILGVAGAYFFGWLIAWVRRGFSGGSKAAAS